MGRRKTGTKPKKRKTATGGGYLYVYDIAVQNVNGTLTLITTRAKSPIMAVLDICRSRDIDPDNITSMSMIYEENTLFLLKALAREKLELEKEIVK